MANVLGGVMRDELNQLYAVVPSIHLAHCVNTTATEGAFRLIDEGDEEDLVDDDDDFDDDDDDEDDEDEDEVGDDEVGDDDFADEDGDDDEDEDDEEIEEE
jgi:hypothetical protein